MITIITAMTKDRVIGKDGRLPWNIPEDLAHFKRVTDGNTVVMGRKTFESIGGPLPNRNNIIVSTTMENSLDYEVCADVRHALLLGKTYGKEVFVIGGRGIFRDALPDADRMIISYIKKNYEGNTRFPEWDKEEWEETHREDHEEFVLVLYKRRTEG